MKRISIQALLAAIMLCAAATVAGEDAQPVVNMSKSEPIDRMELDASSVRGNRELPKVLYIVPWKGPGDAALTRMPANRLVDEVMARVDRDVFIRQTRYFEQLYGASEQRD